MPIIRDKLDFETNFTRLPNGWLRDTRLSLRAIGLLAQLHSHSVGWRVTLKSLAAQNNCGVDAIRSAVTELEAAGYLMRSQERSAGQFAEAIWRTTEPPLLDLPMTVEPVTANPMLKKTIDKNNQLEETYAHSFKEFWAYYPRKIGYAAAEKAFAKAVRGTAVEDIVAGAKRLANDPNLPDTQYVPYPATWLNRAGWLDEPYPVRAKALLTDEQASAIRAAKAASEAAAREDYLRQIAQAASAATPPPMCEHGKTVVSCIKCARKLAKSD